MTRIKNRLVVAVSVCSLALLLVSPESLLAQKSEKLSNDTVGAIGHLVVKAAHFTGKSPQLVRRDSPKVDGNIVTYSLVMEYYGAGTGRRYVAHIDIHMVRVSQGDGLKAMRVAYSDNNVVPANAAKLSRVVPQINNLLGVP